MSSKVRGVNNPASQNNPVKKANPSRGEGSTPAQAGAGLAGKQENNASSKTPGVEDKSVRETVKQLKEAASEVEQRDVNFKVLLEEDVIQVQVENESSGELIRSIPPDEIIEIRKRIDAFVGLLVDVMR